VKRVQEQTKRMTQTVKTLHLVVFVNHILLLSFSSTLSQAANFKKL